MEEREDTIRRQAAIDAIRSEIVNTNPDCFKASDEFVEFMDDEKISSFGSWQWANGFNTAIVSAKLILGKLPSAEPERETGKWVGIREYCNYLRSLDGNMYVPSGIGIPLKYCNSCWESAERDTNYCPNCGVYMRGDEDGTGG